MGWIAALLSHSFEEPCSDVLGSRQVTVIHFPAGEGTEAVIVYVFSMFAAADTVSVRIPGTIVCQLRSPPCTDIRYIDIRNPMPVCLKFHPFLDVVLTPQMDSFPVLFTTYFPLPVEVFKYDTIQYPPCPAEVQAVGGIRPCDQEIIPVLGTAIIKFQADLSFFQKGKFTFLVVKSQFIPFRQSEGRLFSPLGRCKFLPVCKV